ncbi:MAG: gluconeogenesis factor YvcK family protein [Gammaproteobacteria bacterium]
MSLLERDQLGRGHADDGGMIVALGGGSGLPVVLTALRHSLPASCRITAIVTASDDGGSSGVLRRKYGVLPPGDIRNCLLALARVAPEVSAALQYRFDAVEGPVAEHPVGNLLLTALDMVAADEVTAVRLAAELLGVSDRVLPSTTRRIDLVADLVDGRSVHGESAIPRSGMPIKRVRTDPADPATTPGVLQALTEARAIILGPGSLYTSVLANLVIPGVVEAVARSRAVRIFVCNAMTEPGETDGYDIAEHLGALAAHGLDPALLDYVIVNTTPIPPKTRARYAAEGAVPVNPDVVPPGEPPVIVRADVLDVGPVARHAPEKLGPILRELSSRRVDPVLCSSAPGPMAAR